ncbi:MULTISPECIES: alpha-ketoacid dehydrogenase subunit beta [Shouchella]|uniref:Alpha-ketoacid dehydrogenase subunit beta n=1 Tax=Shouchella hunanensis TaxID=766894 RepID=A0ABY7W078_9BACI|nr:MULTISPECIES: alpha-ketoacid dehydrogenase subunit beta [Shouchella]WDF02363.1 alpha-ketoacid dehydrogenase subunit beta [Shouchella hunanensis]GAF20624.1 branched-chain alpha-keto acid dehydrogenase, E1 component, beta subunit [Bacillus sp. JCM 19047]
MEATKAQQTRSMTMVQAVNDALRVALEQDETVLLLGEDIGRNGGVFRATDGLQAQFGEERVIDTPLSEAGIVGTAVGLAVSGSKPIVEIQFMGFVYPAYEQIMTHVSRIRMRSLSHYTVPMVIRAPYGAGIRAPEIHSDSMEALFTHMPGIKVVCPSTPTEAKGLLLAALRDPDPVLMMEPLRLYRGEKEDVALNHYETDIGKATKLSEGKDVTLLAWGAMVAVVKKAAAAVAEEGIACDVIDLRTLFPLDKDTIAESVQKTGRAVVVHEAHATGGLGNDLVSVINDTSFLSMRSPIERVTGFDVPVPIGSLEDHYIPSVSRVVEAIHKTVQF